MDLGKTSVSEIEGLAFGRYIPIRLLGKGAMGRVYLSEDPVLQRHVAVKVIVLEETLDEKTRTSFLERFNLEARASAKLRHPSIVTVFDAGEQGGFPWIAFEFIEGESLEDLLIRQKKLSYSQIKTILMDIASALQHAHDAGIVHRDVKPANILIDKKTGVSKLSDFGVIKAPFSMATQEGMTLGSPGYMSPEQIDGSGVDPRSDLFSLGIIFYQMLTGVHPFLRDTLQSTLYSTLMGDFTPVRQILPDVKDEIELMVNSLLKVEKGQRVCSAHHFLIALKNSGNENNAIESTGFINAATKLVQNIKAKPFLFRVIHSVIVGIKKFDVMLFNAVKNPKMHQFFKNIWFYAVKMFENFPRMITKVKNDRKIKVSILTSAIILATFLVSYSMYENFFSLTKDEKAALGALAEDGYKGSPSQLLNKCEMFIEKNELRDAQNIAKGLFKIKKDAAHAFILNARIELKNRDGSDAIEAINRAKRASGYSNAFNDEKASLLEDLKEYISDDEISREMIDCITYTLNLGKDRVLKKWIYEKPYWLRWNTIHILNETGQKIDMVEVYILDLKYGSSMRVRIKAANKLGEIGDKRAIVPLQEIAQRGFADPIVSATAQSVLDEYFKDK